MTIRRRIDPPHSAPPPRFYASDADGSTAVLAPDETHHLTRVLRLGPGASVIVFDGRGGEWLGRVHALAGSRATVALIEARAPAAEPPVHVTLGVSLLKGVELDDVVRDATALGAGAIVPLVSAHVALADRARTARTADRWRRVAIAAAKQCRRAVVPAVASVMTLDDLLADTSFDARFLCVEPVRTALGADAAPPSLSAITGPIAGTPRPSRALVLVGPEGGWRDDEIAAAVRAGAVSLNLGPRTLRAALAPVVALAALWTIWGW